MKMNKKTKQVMLCGVALAVGLSVLPSTGVLPGITGETLQVEAATTEYKTTDTLNLRAGASTQHKVLVAIPKGKPVIYVGKSGSWFKVKYGTKTGYVNAKYLVKLVAPKAPATPKSSTVVSYVTTESLNMRTGASATSKLVLTIPKGKSVTYQAKSGNWFKITYGGKTGYVNSSYLKKPNDTIVISPSVPATPVVVKPTEPKLPVVGSPTVYPAPSNKTPGKYVGGVLLVNKKNGLPSSYNPGVNATAQKALNAMIADAKKQGVSLSTISSYRTYAYQAGLYNNYVAKHGKAKADRFSAKPGYSEHQTGLSFDFGGVNKTHWLEESFAGTKEGKWLEANAHTYGFHLRYQKGKESITGYMYEPWHFRYLGTDLATKVKASGKTLEEYLNYVGK